MIESRQNKIKITFRVYLAVSFAICYRWLYKMSKKIEIGYDAKSEVPTMIKKTQSKLARKFAIASVLFGTLFANPIMAQTNPTSGQNVIAASEKIVAIVNGETIYLEEILDMAKKLPSQYRKLSLDVVYPSLVDRAVDARLVRDAGRKNGFASDPDVKSRMKQIEGQVISEIFLKKTIMPQLTESALRKIYQESKSQMGGKEQVKARHILLKTEDKARQLIDIIKSGAEFSKVASEHSVGPSAASGGDLGWFEKEQMVPSFSKAAFALRPGEIVDQPVKTQFGWHIILVEDRRSAKPPSFEEARNQLAAQLSESLLKELMMGLRLKATIQKFTMNGDPIQN
ncbi:MAG: hypothetical protein CMM58_05975 [Rhodospirillaceae bacterium]|mgnify:CR=1 FL=1|nr:hypothetical protein [Rhodospirillaceae bacterium]|tara:strand:+ start:100 stop:1122 length:1023 start_codon:yes stop_codon:yes gene_type:complete